MSGQTLLFIYLNIGHVVFVVRRTDTVFISWHLVAATRSPDTHFLFNQSLSVRIRKEPFVQDAMNCAAEFRVIVDKCATADMVADDMPTDDAELRMTGPLWMWISRTSLFPRSSPLHLPGQNPTYC